ncbi:MAG: alpha/beta fold hydrolase [Gemmatimonadota bacterium]
MPVFRDLDDRPRLFWEVSGPIGGRPLVLIHGYGAGSFTWDAWLPEMTQRHRIYRVDLPGFGQSPAPPSGKFTPNHHAAILLEWLHREVEGRPVLLGHSLGGGVATAMALTLQREEPGRVSALILMAGAVLPQYLPRYISLARIPFLGELGLALAPSRLLIRRVLREIVHDPACITDGVVERYTEGLRSFRVRRTLLEAARSLDVEAGRALAAQLGQLTLPVLLLWGASDHVVPVSQGRALEGLIPRANLVVLKECGHLPQEEQPRAALDAILGFLDGLAPGGAS